MIPSKTLQGFQHAVVTLCHINAWPQTLFLLWTVKATRTKWLELTWTLRAPWEDDGCNLFEILFLSRCCESGSRDGIVSPQLVKPLASDSCSFPLRISLGRLLPPENIALCGLKHYELQLPKPHKTISMFGWHEPIAQVGCISPQVKQLLSCHSLICFP